MAIEIRRNRQGELIRSSWWCRLSVNGERTTYSLHVPIKGKPPASWIPSVPSWPMEDKGDVWFEKSRTDAIAAFEALKANPPTPKTDDLKESFNRAYKAQQRKKFRVVKIRDLLKVYDAKFRDAGDRVSTSNYAQWQKNIIQRFITWWGNNKWSTKTPFHDVTMDRAQAFLRFLSKEKKDGRRMTADTLRRIKSHLVRTFENFCPYATINPFKFDLPAREEDDEAIHREPLSPREIDLALKTAKDTDPLLYDLMVTGFSTALRKGDICNLKWSSITDTEWSYNGERKKGSIRLKTQKTGQPVNIPIFPLFARVLDKRLSEKNANDKLVFPEAAKIYKENPDALSRRIKKIFALALAESKGALIEDAHTESYTSPDKALPLVLNALPSATLSDTTKEHIRLFMPLYANGLTYRQIVQATGKHKSSISNALQIAQKIANVNFINPTTQRKAGTGIGALVRKVTQSERKIGLKSASIYDFHCLRTTFVTLAAKNRIPLEQVRLITGHTDTSMLEQYYNRASAVDLAQEFGDMMPKSLMADIPPALPNAQNKTTIPAATKPQDRASALENLKKLLASNQLSKKEKRDLVLTLMGGDE